jgi:hypothetical protein
VTVEEIPTIVAIVAIVESRCSSLRHRLLCTVQCHDFLKLLLLFLIASCSSAAG